MKKVLCKAFTTIVFVGGILLSSSNCNAAEALCDVKYEEAQGELKIPDQYITRYTKRQKETVQRAVQTEAVDGKTCAEILNKIQDRECYRNAVKDVLDDYYSQSELSAEKDDFVMSLKESVEDLVQDYEEAKEERDSYQQLDYNPNRILLTLEDGISETSIIQAMEKISDGGKLIDITGKQGGNLQADDRSRLYGIAKRMGYQYAIVEVGTGQTVQNAMDVYKDIEGVVSVEKDWKLTLDSTAYSNDIFADKKWEYEHLELNKAWMVSYQYNSNPAVRVAVIDSGMELSHEDLQGQYIDAYSVDITQNMKQLSKCDVQDAYLSDSENAVGHGTGVASVINACKDNRKGIAGVTANNSRLMAIKVMDNNGEIATSDICDGIAYAMMNGAKVINISLGGYGHTSERDVMQRIVNTAHNFGIVIVAAAGNGKSWAAYGDTDFHCPSDLDGVIGVIATTKTDEKTAKSNYGFAKDICAPGEGIICAKLNSQYHEKGGTSFAAPIVSGTAALMLKVNPNLTPDQVENIIKETATDIGTPGRDEQTAYGLINPYRAVEKAARTN